MKKAIPCAAIICLMACAALPSVAQIQWTAEQQAVWKTETTIFDDFVSGQSPSEYYDDSYVGWPLNAPIPVPKANMEKMVKYQMSQGGKALFFDAIPVVIWVNGNYAYADYYYRAVYQDKDGKKTNEHGRWLDVLMKKDGKWVLVGDHGGRDPEPANR